MNVFILPLGRSDIISALFNCLKSRETGNALRRMLTFWSIVLSVRSDRMRRAAALQS